MSQAVIVLKIGFQFQNTKKHFFFAFQRFSGMKAENGVNLIPYLDVASVWDIASPSIGVHLKLKQGSVVKKFPFSYYWILKPATDMTLRCPSTLQKFLSFPNDNDFQILNTKSGINYDSEWLKGNSNKLEWKWNILVRFCCRRFRINVNFYYNSTQYILNLNS